VSDEIRLRPTNVPERPIEVECIQPQQFAALSTKEIASLPVWIGREQRQLGDYFEVAGERSTSVRIEGDAGHLDALGAEMSDGTLVIDGNAGRALGRAMRGGRLHVLGNASDGVGSPTPGASRGMLGGEIIITGSAGTDAGAWARRGLIVIGGNAGTGAGRGMIAGTVIVLGDAAADAAAWNKRGSLIVMGAVDVGLTYRYSCTYRPPFLPVVLRSIAARYGLPIADRWIAGEYRRFCGDLAEVGKGEILQWRAPGT
jgi:formylmethanofuran dehydrogenase subunit C